MRVLIINEVCGTGSTGKICTSLADEFLTQGDEVRIAYGRNNDVPEKYAQYAVRIGKTKDVYLHAIYTRLTDRHGFGSKSSTAEFIKWAEEYNPDLVWIHNVHGYYVNIETLFMWIKSRPNMKKKWTLHDCWSFTGHCSHFAFVKCEKWKKRCSECPQRAEYPKSFISSAEWNFDSKKSIFTSIPNMELIVPSEWLAGLVRKSFLSEYPIHVVHNKINREVFKPTISNFRKKNGIEQKIVILGVANVWNSRKGLNDYINLTRMLNDRYVVVLVGLKERQIKQIQKQIFMDGFIESDDEGRVEKNEKGVVVPQKVAAVYREITGERYSTKATSHASLLCLPRTENAAELAGIYTTADYFVNMSYEDNYPTVNLEAIACGTQVITYRTGGAPETIGFCWCEE